MRGLKHVNLLAPLLNLGRSFRSGHFSSEDRVFAGEHAGGVVAEAGIVASLGDVEAAAELAEDAGALATLDVRGTEVEGKSGDLPALLAAGRLKSLRLQKTDPAAGLFVEFGEHGFGRLVFLDPAIFESDLAVQALSAEVGEVVFIAFGGVVEFAEVGVDRFGGDVAALAGG